MGTSNMRPLEKIAVTLAVRLGAVHPEVRHLDPMTSTAVYLTRLEIKEYIESIIGPDDMSEAAQKLRAALRKM